MLPCFQRSNKIIQLFIICGIIQNRATKFFAKVSNEFIFLHQNTTNACNTKIALEFKSLTKIRKLQQWSMSKFFYQKIKDILLCLTPMESYSLLCQLIQWGGNGAEIWHKAMVKSSKSMETSHLWDRRGRRPTSNSLHLRFIYLNSLRCHNIANKRYSIGAKGALLDVTK